MFCCQVHWATGLPFWAMGTSGVQGGSKQRAYLKAAAFLLNESVEKTCWSQ